MGGGLMQLVAYGAQDIYLTGNPQITFFKVVYRRHTNFSMETISQTFNGTAGDNATVTATISRNGDLVHKLYLNSTTDSITNGSNIISEVELEIGGQRIDRHYQEWMKVWNELSTDESKALPLKSMQGDIGSKGSTGVNGVVQIPLQFWFCRNPGLALPLIALQYHEVKVKIQLGSVTGTADVDLVADYIYLDTDERRRFAQVSHEYLIEQLQRETFTGASNQDYKLNFNHPVKELIWTSNKDYTGAQLKLNGHDRFAEQKQEYFLLRQPFDYHTAVPRQNLPTGSLNLLKNGQQHNLIFTEFTGAATASGAGAFGSNYLGSSATPDSEGELTYSTATGNLILQGAGAPGSVYSAGTQIAIIINTLGAGVDTDIFASTGIPVAGDVYFTSIISDATVADELVTAAVTPPTNADGTKVLSEIKDDSGDAGASVTILKVTNTSSNQARTSQLTERINVYSFALKPEEHQPSGTCNFSRIDNAQLKITGNPVSSGSFSVYAVNYNVLRIMSGMGGLAYSN